MGEGWLHTSDVRASNSKVWCSSEELGCQSVDAVLHRSDGVRVDVVETGI